MPIDRPTAPELLSAVREHLAEKVAPTLQGQAKFHLRVANNVLAIVERTLDQGDALDAAEQKRLEELLKADGDLLDLNRELAQRIQSGDLDEQKDAVLTHLRQTVEDKLSLSNPRYTTPRD